MSRKTHDTQELSISNFGLNIIKHFEGFESQAYVCPAGHLTIGYGHLIQDHEKDSLRTVSEDQALDLLRKDVSEAESAVRRLVQTELTQGQFDSLVSWTYNLGHGNLRRSTMLRRINSGKHHDAYLEMKKWTRGGGKVLRGLVARREIESFLYLYS